MTLVYHLGDSAFSQEVTVNDFEGFQIWLWGLGAGLHQDDPQTLAWWAEAYRMLKDGPFTNTMIELPRAGFGKSVRIVGVK